MRPAFLHPRHWLLWLIFFCVWLITRLPLSWQQRSGMWLGRRLYRLGRYRRHIARTNLQIAFPEQADAERQALLLRHFERYGQSIMESFTAWWAQPSVLHNHVNYEGLEHLQQALDKGDGVILLSGHFTTLELGLRLLGQRIPFDIMYRPHKNRLFEAAMSAGRQRWCGDTIDRKDVRGFIARLRSGRAVWYGPDQDYGRRHSVFVPFMGYTAATVTATARLARISGASIVPYFVERDGLNYRVIVQPALENFPQGDEETDAITINRIIEQQIRRQPEDYLWTHRRYKTRPQGETSPYKTTFSPTPS